MQSCHLMRRRALLIILVLLGASLSGCQELFPGPDPTLVDFHHILSAPVVRIQRLDTDNDEDEREPKDYQREWVIFYKRGGVIFGLVYDVQGDPPVVMKKRSCSGWPLEGAWHLQNPTEKAEPACHKIAWNDQMQAKVPGT